MRGLVAFVLGPLVTFLTLLEAGVFEAKADDARGSGKGKGMSPELRLRMRFVPVDTGAVRTETERECSIHRLLG